MDLELEKRLVKECLANNRIAQSNLYHQYCNAMYNICHRIVGNREDAEDVLQTAFVDVFNQLPTFKFESTIGAWIKRIIIHRSIDQLRKRKVKFEEFDGQEPNGFVDENVELNMAGVKNAIASLPDGYRAIFNLYAVEGYDHEEISQIMGFTVSTSKSQYHRAKIKVHQYIMDQGGRKSIYN